MLREIIANVPISRQPTMQELQAEISREFVGFVHQNASVNLTKNFSALTSLEMEKIISVTKTIYKKIFESAVVSPDTKIFIANSVLCRMFDLWKISTAPELFFAKIRQAFTPAQIVAALALYMNTLESSNWILNFFHEHKKIFPQKNSKIRTIALYYSRVYSGGIEKFLSLIIPIYIKLGYRVILFTEEYKQELEYPLPPPF